jgi:hypothetical protein
VLEKLIGQFLFDKAQDSSRGRNGNNADSAPTGASQGSGATKK